MRTYKYRLRPTKAQELLLNAALDSTRLLYNECLQELIDHYKLTGKSLNRFAQDKQHNAKRHPDIYSPLVDTTIRRLHYSFAAFFRGAKEKRKVGFPRFKPENRWRSIDFRDAVSNRIESDRFLAGKKLGGPIKFVKHRDLSGTLKQCRIVKGVDGWYLMAVCELSPCALPKANNSIGLDFGITHLVADSDGVKVENHKFLKKSLRKLAKAQRAVSRKVAGSKRKAKARHIVAKVHNTIANQRADHLHKVARQYVDKYDEIYIEDLRPSSMVRNRNFSRSISDASWGKLRVLLEEKAESAGRIVIAVPPQYTSQKCYSCGELVQKALSVRTHNCPHCGYVECRDINAAKNIHRLGLGLRGVVA